jgi:hypothetical protein
MYKPKLFQYRHAGDKGDRRCSSLISALYGVSGQCHILSSLNPTERTLGTHWTGGWVGLKAGRTQRLKEESLFSARDRTPLVRSSSL